MITVLNDSNGKWCSDAKILREQVAAYFTRLFECSTVPTGSYPTRNQFPTISQIDFDSLGNIPTWDEIREALDSMDPRDWALHVTMDCNVGDKDLALPNGPSAHDTCFWRERSNPFGKAALKGARSLFHWR
ncbi:hypothetical protein V6N12_060896 [Hibiscus sabdariffa]|uniref:Uncharacterized protein n=1 Tax=Hibiscus sabdariffa TaxID=183260 RepID=A0ABR2A4D2_9ROSI